MRTKGCGIVCEYNPFHKGHKYQIEYIKQNLGLPVICAMSGNFVQRGEASCTDKKSRAHSAVKNGADIVLEIPFPYCSMTAERFAKAGVDILAKSSLCSHIAFGSECADVLKLEKIAVFLLDDQAKLSIQVYQSNNPNSSYAVARSEVVKAALGEEFSRILSNPNDILAIEYIKAIKSENYNLIPVAIKRTVDRCDENKGEFASSSYIRTLLAQGKQPEASGFVPDGTDLAEFVQNHAFYEVIHASFTTRTPEQLANICEISGGLEYAIISAAKNSHNYAEMLENLRSKTLTDAKIRRMLLFGFFGLTKQLANEPVMYTQILACSENEHALELLRKARKEKQIILARRISEIRKDTDAFKQFKFCLDAEKTLTITQKLSVK